MPGSILSNISKIYEKYFYSQMYNYFGRIFSSFQCWFKTVHNPQHCLHYMIEKTKQVIIMTFSVPFLQTCLKQSLVLTINIAKLIGYGFNNLPLEFMTAYLNFRKQKTKQKAKVGSTFSDYLNILFDVQKRSIAGPVLSLLILAKCFFKLVLLSSPVMQIITLLQLPVEPWKTNKLFIQYCE